ncbi:MAG: hypothetical protein AB8G99_23255 [Planctomycetaceae bacterium]
MATATSNCGEISEFLTNLYGLSVTASASASKPEGVGVSASYVDSEGTVKGHILCDVAGAAVLGAALTQIPMGAVEDAVSTGSLPENIQENVSEVLNIAVNLVPGQDSNRLVLSGVQFGSLADGVEGLTNDSVLELEVQRYDVKGLLQISHS